MYQFNENINKAINNCFIAFKGIEFLNQSIIIDLPKELKNTYLFQKIKEYENFKDVKLEEINWLLSKCSTNQTVTKLKKYISLERKKANLDLFDYIDYIVNSKHICTREKTVILLSHFEPLLYLVFNTPKQKDVGLKGVASNKLAEISELSTGNIGLLLSFAITKIVFANTDKFTYIDKRLPFRNNILHNGIFDYDSKDITTLYKILLSFILTIMKTKNKLDKK